MKSFTTPGEFISGQVFREPCEVTAPGVTFAECRWVSDGTWEQAMLATGPGTRVLGCQLIGDYTRGHRRGIMCNSANVVIDALTAINMFHSDDAWTIAGWDGTAALEIRNSHLEASGETIIFGGASIPSEDRIPQDIIIQNCTFAKPSRWKTQASCTVKNLFEIKAGKRIRLENIRMSGSWPDGQAGFALLVTVRNQHNDSPWTCVEDVTLRGILAREIQSGLQIDGHDQYANGGLRRLTIEDCRFELAQPDGKLIQIGGGAEDVTIQGSHFWANSDNNSWLTFHDQPLVRFTMRDCDCNEGYYGARGDNHAPGIDSINAYAPDATFENVMLWGHPGMNYTYPPGITVERWGQTRKS